VVATYATGGAGRLSDGCRFAGDTVEDGTSASGGSRHGRGESFEELGVGLRWCDGGFHVIVFPFDHLETV